MNIVAAAANALTRTADAAAAAAGAASGAVINGVVGGVKGSAAGVRDGIRSGSRSTPAAALTFGALGAAGLVEWPVLIGIGATVLVLRQVRADSPPASESVAPAADIGSASVSPIIKSAPPIKSAPAKKSAAKTAKPTVRKASSARARPAPVKR